MSSTLISPPCYGSSTSSPERHVPRIRAQAGDLASAHTRLWQATAALHDAFHLLPSAAIGFSECRPESLPEGPPFMTICQRHLAAGHIVRRKTTPTDLDRPPHITACLR